MVTATYRLTNRYTGPIDIRRVDTSCGCQATEVSPRHLNPGEQATLTVQWRLGARRGTVQQTLMVVHTDASGQEQRLPLGLRAEVTPDVRCDPARLDFPPDRPGSARLRLSPGRLAAFVVRDVSGSHRTLTARWLPDTSEVEVTYTPAVDGPPGRGQTVTVMTDSSNEPQLDVPVTIGRTDF